MSNENQRDHGNFDSYPIKFMIKKNVSRQKIKRRKVFNYSEADWEGMACEIESYDWINIFNGLRICDAWNSFKSKLDISMRIHIPMKTVKFRIQPPWFDSEIFEMTKIKYKYRKIYKETGAEVDRRNYEAYKITIKNKVSEKKSEFILADPCNSENICNNQVNKKCW